MGPAVVGFGATIPALLRRHEDVARESGQLLFYSSVANAAGFFLMAFVLHRYLDYGAIVCVAAAWHLLAVLIHGVAGPAARVRRRAACWAWFWRPRSGSGTSRCCTSATPTSTRPGSSERERETRVFAERFKGPQDVFAIVRKDDTALLLHQRLHQHPSGLGRREARRGAVVGARAADRPRARPRGRQRRHRRHRRPALRRDGRGRDQQGGARQPRPDGGVQLRSHRDGQRQHHSRRRHPLRQDHDASATR